jgi:hypothetical protein
LWLKNAAQQNYHDAAAVARMAHVMKHDKNDVEMDDDDNDDDDDESSSDSSKTSNDEEVDGVVKETITANNNKPKREFVAKSPLCLHCRRPADNLCPDCEGAYFCLPPRPCRDLGWSHSCQCETWKVYTSHRKELSTFHYLDADWQLPLVGRDFQLSEEPYKKFLSSRIGFDFENNNEYSASWWRTEINGWAGGQSSSAQRVDPTIRQSYQQGFSPIPSNQIPPQRRVDDADYGRACLSRKNAVGLWKLSSWEDYYKLRNIRPTSPVALLCTFPLTVYHAIVEYGEVPVTVAKMLKRPLRIHLVGAEKEMNFLDIFQEVGYLLPEDLKVRTIYGKMKNDRVCLLIVSFSIPTLFIMRFLQFLCCVR